MKKFGFRAALAALLWGLLYAAGSAFYIIQPRPLLARWSSSLLARWVMLFGGLFLLPLDGPFT